MASRLAIAITLTGSIVFSSQSLSLTLNEAVQYTLNTNPGVLQSSSNRLAVGEELDQAKAGYLPNVDVNLGIGWEQTSNPTTRARGDGTVSYRREETGIFLRQMLFDGFATPSEVDRHSARVNSRAYTVFGTSEITSLRVAESYLNVLRRQELLDLAEQNLALHVSTNEKIVRRVNQGVGRESDEEQSLGRLALAQTNLASVEGNLRDAKIDFLRVIGVPAENLVNPDVLSEGLPGSLEEAIQLAVDNQPTLKSANADVESAKAQHETAKSPFYPRFDLEVGANANHDLDGIPGSNDDISAMLRMRYNIFSGGKDLARKRETAYLINTAKEIRNLTRRQVEESVRLSWNAYQIVARQLPAFRRYKEASEKTYQGYQKQFILGRRTLLDTLDSANEVFLSGNDFVNVQYDFKFNQYRILASMGRLNRTLQVLLPREATDLVNVEPNN